MASSSFPSDATDPAARQGARVLGRFVLARRLGTGGMGEVWLAQDEKLAEAVALKFVSAAWRTDRRAIAGLIEEAKRTRGLTHPHIVRVYDFVEDANDAAIVMEFVDGETLAQRLATAPRGCLSPDEIAPWIAPLCAALDYAHTEAGLVHRDLKPSNILLARDGRVKIADFGIACRLSDAPTTATHHARGTTCYMSPQRQLGEAATPADDVYALGVTLYEALTGRPPFHTGNVAAQAIHSRAAPINDRRRALDRTLPDVPAEWENAIRTCLDKDPRGRPACAGELVARLGLSPGTDGARIAKGRRRAGALIAGAVVAAAVLAGLWSSVRSGKPSPTPGATAGTVEAFREWTDDFGDGLGGWVAWGNPPPQRIASFQGRRWVFDNNGDGMHTSGVSSLELFACPHGFSLETEVYLSVTNPAGCHCEAYVGLTREPQAWPNTLGSAGDIGGGVFIGLNYAGDGCWGTPAEWRRHLWLTARFWSEHGGWVNIEDELPRTDLQRDELSNRWVRLEAVVEEDRSLRFLVDGREVWRPRQRIHPEVLNRQRVVAWGRSLGTAGKAYHDWVRLRAADRGEHGLAPPTATPVGEVLAWTQENWVSSGRDLEVDAAALSLSAGAGEEQVVRSRKVIAGPLVFSCELQPLLRSMPDGRDRARVGLVGRYADGAERFVGVELAGGETWLIDTARGANHRRVRRLAGLAPGSWQEFSFHVERPATFSVVGARTENFVHDLGAWPESGWQLEVAVAESGDGVRFAPVRLGVVR